MGKWLGKAGKYKSHCLIFTGGFLFAVLCFVIINAILEPFETSEYCGTRCHEMKSLYDGWKASKHYVNSSGTVTECIDCHLPQRKDYFRHMYVKTITGARDMFKYYFGGPYDANKMQQRVLAHLPDERCLKCHSNLLGQPSSAAVGLIHQGALSEPNSQSCVQCHMALHKRQSDEKVSK